MKKYIVYTNYIWLIAKFSTAEKADKEFRGAQNGSSLKKCPMWKTRVAPPLPGLEVSPRLSQGPLPCASSPEGAPVTGSLQAGYSLGWWKGGPVASPSTIVAELITGQKGAPVLH